MKKNKKSGRRMMLPAVFMAVIMVTVAGFAVLSSAPESSAAMVGDQSDNAAKDPSLKPFPRGIRENSSAYIFTSCMLTPIADYEQHIIPKSSVITIFLTIGSQYKFTFESTEKTTIYFCVAYSTQYVDGLELKIDNPSSGSEFTVHVEKGYKTSILTEKASCQGKPKPVLDPLKSSFVLKTNGTLSCKEVSAEGNVKLDACSSFTSTVNDFGDLQYGWCCLSTVGPNEVYGSSCGTVEHYSSSCIYEIHKIDKSLTIETEYVTVHLNKVTSDNLQIKVMSQKDVSVSGDLISGTIDVVKA